MNIQQQDTVTVVEFGQLADSLDLDALDEMGGKLISLVSSGTATTYVLDFHGTEMIGSHFLEILVRAWKRVGERDGQLALSGLTPFCTEVIRLSRLDRLWDLYPTKEDAVAALQC